LKIVPNELRRLLVFVCYSASDYAVALLFEALCYKLEGPGSIPECFPGEFFIDNPSGSTMALGSTQPVTEMSTRNNTWGVKVVSA
jgi:hypothetical protein